MIGELFGTIRDTVLAYGWWATVGIKSTFTRRMFRRVARDRHVALLAWHFPPSVDSGVYRPASLARYGTTFGWKMSVICGPYPTTGTEEGKYLLETLPEGTVIHRVIRPRLQTSYNYFPRVNGGFLNSLAAFSTVLQLLKKNPPAIVMASGPPFNSFVAGYYIASYYKARLVLDYRDEWTESPFPLVDLRSVDRYWERRCLKKANAVFFTTQSQLDHQLAVFDVLERAKCTVIPNAWEPRDFGNTMHLSDDYSRKDGRFVLSFIGKLSDRILPGDFLTVLTAVLSRSGDLRNRICLRLVGNRSENAMAQLSDFPFQDTLEILDHVPKPVANQMMRASSALLILNNDDWARYRQGKLYDYLAAGPPILVFGANGEMAELVTKLQAGVIVPANNADSLEQALRLLINRGSSGQYKASRQKWLSDNTRERMAENMIRVFDGLVKKQ